MTKDEALKLALDALEFMSHVDSIFANEFDFQINAIKDVLAQPEQEPVAWMRTSGTGSPVVTEELLIAKPEYRRNFQTPLYTTPPQRKPLTDEEINQIADEFVVNYRIPAGSHYDFARAIEAAHGIKGEA